ncbi:SENESCENCE-ASSOCIATED GENE 21 protein [Cucumis melo var. makuwa]|uniref:SENESCENCE-ASSOCIATED GENE 21 protein n=2 Tax=Cucumis melo TaxID=3656 RepID=A0A5D3E0D0_CUCMM|nr:SENESCENCE-ASSOCIATED GENE 21 protein [Cucumis melo var. makuwa]
MPLPSSFSTLSTLFRRGYATASAEGVAARISSIMKKKEESLRIGREKMAVSWVPDPVTGYYRPENCGAEMDAADLRAMLLNPATK